MQCHFILVMHNHGYKNDLQFSCTLNDNIRLCDACDVRHALNTAVDAWFKYTQSGKDVYALFNELTGVRFSLRDMAAYVDNTALKSILSKHGLDDVAITEIAGHIWHQSICFGPYIDAKPIKTDAVSTCVNKDTNVADDAYLFDISF